MITDLSGKDNPSLPGVDNQPALGDIKLSLASLLNKSVPKNPPHQKSFDGQEILMLAQAFMRESLNPIRGTCKKANVMWKDVGDAYHLLRRDYDRKKLEHLFANDDFFVSHPFRNAYLHSNANG